MVQQFADAADRLVPLVREERQGGPARFWTVRRSGKGRKTRSARGGRSSGAVISQARRTPGGTCLGTPVSRSQLNQTRTLGSRVIARSTRRMSGTLHDLE